MSECSKHKRPGEALAWFTDDHLTDKSATTYDKAVADRWKEKGWPVNELCERAAVLALINENEALLNVLANAHDFILNDARTRRMCDETGQVSPLFPKRKGILAAIYAAMGKEAGHD
jgi:hypothetical protein